MPPTRLVVENTLLRRVQFTLGAAKYTHEITGAQRRQTLPQTWRDSQHREPAETIGIAPFVQCSVMCCVDIEVDVIQVETFAHYEVQSIRDYILLEQDTSPLGFSFKGIEHLGQTSGAGQGNSYFMCKYSFLQNSIVHLRIAKDIPQHSSLTAVHFSLDWTKQICFCAYCKNSKALFFLMCAIHFSVNHCRNTNVPSHAPFEQWYFFFPGSECTASQIALATQPADILSLCIYCQETLSHKPSKKPNDKSARTSFMLQEKQQKNKHLK